MLKGKPFQKGQSGNPRGRPRVPEEVREMARAHTEEAIKALARVLRSKRSPASAVVAAANALLDRAWGKPQQRVVASGGLLDGLSYEQRVALEAAFAALDGGTGAG